jgi:phosphoribulokinase
MALPPCGLRIVVFPETHRIWTARALEHDLAARGRTVEAAIDTLVRLIQAHVEYDCRHNRKPLSAFAAAPKVYWTAFDRAAELPLQMELNWKDMDRPARVVAAMVSDHPAIRPSSAERIA